MMKGKPTYFELTLKIEPIEIESDETDQKTNTPASASSSHVKLTKEEE